MGTLFVLLAGFAIFLFVRTNQLARELFELRRRTEQLTEHLGRLLAKLESKPGAEPQERTEARSAPTPPPPPVKVAAEPARPAAPLEPPKPPKTPEPAFADGWKAAPSAKPETKTPPPPPPPKKRPAISWEQQIGARLPVWIGGIALALSGIFLVKYSIDTGLLSPAVRCVLAAILGAALLGGAQWVVALKTVANGARIAQAMSGAGLAILFGDLFAAGTVYEFVSPAVTFAGMALVTALAVVLSLRHGPPIALLGMVGGFLTPALVGASEPNPTVLFGYLTALTIGLFIVIRRQGWWWLAWPVLVTAFVWELLWLAGNGTPGDGLWLGLFLIALSAIAFAFIQPQEKQETAPFAWQGLLVTAAAAILLMSVVVVRSDFAVVEWALYGALTVGAVVLAVWDQERYRFVPWMAMAVCAAMLTGWVTPFTELFTITLLSFAALFTVTGVVMIWRARHPDDWGWLACAAMLVLYLIAFARLHDVVEIMGAEPLWGMIALALATLSTLVAGRVGETIAVDAARRTVAQRLLAQFSLTAVVFLSIGLVIELGRDDMPIAFAGVVLVVSWISARVDVAVLRPAVAALAGVFVLFLLPQFQGPFDFALRTLYDRPLENVAPSPIAPEPLIYLGVPALLFALASLELRRRTDDLVVAIFEGAAAVLLAIAGYFLIRGIDTPAAQILLTPASSYWGAIVSQTLLAYTIALVALGQRFARPAIVATGIALGIVAVARVVHFDIQPVQLLAVWVPMALGEAARVVRALPMAESPVFYLGFPAALLVALRMVLGLKRDDLLVRIGEYVAVVFVGLMGYFLIRHAFNPAAEALTAAGSRFEGGVISQAQIVYAIALVLAARIFGRVTLVHAAMVAAAMAVVRILAFDVELMQFLKVAMQLSLGRVDDPTLMVPMAAAPLFHMGAPAALLGALAYVAQSQRANFARAVEFAAIAFAGLMTYYLIRHAFTPAAFVFAGEGTYLERGVLTNALLVFGVALGAASMWLRRETFWIAGIAFAAIATVRIVVFDFFASSPLVAPHDVGAWPVVNALMLPYGLPIVWLMLAAAALGRRGEARVLPYIHGTALLFLFAFVSLNVRQYFHGPVLNAPGAEDAEVYAYSIAWLLLGIGLLVAGAARKDRVMRLASLAVMVLTVGKVFLYDASELTGLLRVLSFLGLGLSLLGLSWFYTRYVFAPAKEEPPGAEPQAASV